MSDDLHNRITTLADQLTEPHTHREPYTTWTGSRHRITHHHATTQHGLLTQLYRAVLPTNTLTDGGGPGIPTSRPPLEVEALSRHHQIVAGARAWTNLLGLTPRATPESNIRALIGALHRLDYQQQHNLHADLRRWTSWCRVYLGLEQVRQITGVRCPLTECTQLGTLRINLTTSHGMCTACGATWDRDNIGVLANHIKVSKGAAA